MSAEAMTGAADSATNSKGEAIDAAKAARIKFEPYPHQVRIECEGETIAESTQARLLIETWAPDIYVPVDDVRTDLFSASETRTYCPYKAGHASHVNATVGGKTVADVAWDYDDPVDQPGIKGLYAFYFDKVSIFVDGQLVRGHVRDPHKTIVAKPLGRRLRLEMAGKMIVDSNQVQMLYETGLPPRYYVPESDVAMDALVPSTRQSVCTYKGEAVYNHIRVGDELAENVVWSYPEPWLDFSPDCAQIKGYLGIYTSVFDRFLLDDEEQDVDEATRESDRGMLARPTVDKKLRNKMASSA